jgi:hypothetical protein
MPPVWFDQSAVGKPVNLTQAIALILDLAVSRRVRFLMG